MRTGSKPPSITPRVSVAPGWVMLITSSPAASGNVPGAAETYAKVPSLGVLDSIEAPNDLEVRAKGSDTIVPCGGELKSSAGGSARSAGAEISSPEQANAAAAMITLRPARTMYGIGYPSRL